MRTLYRFHGGVHPPTNKLQSVQTPIAQAGLPSRLVVPLHQHVGNRAKPAVQVGERVLKGQLFGMPEGSASSAVHAPTSGIVSAIDMQVVAHPSGLPDLCVTLIPDGKDEWIARDGVDYRTASPAEVRRSLRLAGVVGLGGAVFPSDLKLRGGKHKIKTLVLNGAECEPYITCDDMLMRERADGIVRGAEMMRHIMDAEEVLIGIEDNKPEAIAAMQAAVDAEQCRRMEVIVVPTLYPSGGAKQLIRMLTGIEVAAGTRSTDMGVQCFNVATAYSAYRAITCGEPLISRIVTVTGNVQHPQNFEALIGTPVNELVALAGALPGTNGHIMGGPMMGVELPSDTVTVTKATNCIIESSPALFPAPPLPLPCIRCTRCADACPADLQPQELYWFAQSRNFGKAQNYHLFDCIECGACSYVCPSNIQLVQYFRFAKSEIRALEHEKEAAALARERYEFRQSRIERDKQERAEKLARKEKTALAAMQPAATPGAAQESSAQSLIQAAIERAREQAASVKPKNIDSLTPDQQARIAEIEARRARAHELAHPDNEQAKD